MHSNIYQISNKPIEVGDYTNCGTYEDNSGDFADYIGNNYDGDDRKERIENFGYIIRDVFTPKGDGVFEYKGKDAMNEFKEKWLSALKEQLDAMTANNMLSELRLSRLAGLTERTHLNVESRVDIESWAGGVAYPFGELFEYADHMLKKGDCIYIGAVIDYHY